MMNRGQGMAIVRHDAACIELMRLWPRDEKLPDHVDVWACDFLRRVETSLARTDTTDALVQTHPSIREFVEVSTYQLMLDVYLHLDTYLTDILILDTGDDEDALHVEDWAREWFRKMNNSTRALMGWVRIMQAMLEYQQEEKETLHSAGALGIYRDANTLYKDMLFSFLRELRNEPVVCAALVSQIQRSTSPYTSTVEGYEAIWGWKKSVTRLQNISVVS